MTTPQYELLRASITEDDQRKAFDLLTRHIGHEQRTTINAIAYHLYGATTDNTIRKARDVIEDLRNLGVPVCSTSGTSGRWLAANDTERQQCITDFRSRRASIDKVIHALEKATVPPPAQFPTGRDVVQPGLF